MRKYKIFMKKYKIVCITQVYNEIEKGNLERFVRYVKPLVDASIIFDDGSTDGSYEYISKVTPYVIRSSQNDFADEVAHKQLLIEKAKELGADFILWLDADEVLSANAEKRLQELCQEAVKSNIDGFSFHEINLWRSNNWRRVDSLYDIGWFVRLWRVTPELSFPKVKKGLHKLNYPPTIKRIEKADVQVLHYGFSSDKNLAYKYLVYKSHGQRGYDMLDRLISEEKLQLEKVPANIFPKVLYKNDPQPQKRSFIESLAMVEHFKSQVFRPKYSIVCLIYKSVEWLDFVYKQVLKYTDMKDKEFFFIANDATPEVLAYLKNNYIPHYIWDNTEDNKKEWYINNVYRAWNFGAKQAKGDFVVFINSDMAFSTDWFENLLKWYNGKNCITSRLVESGKLKSGLYGIEKNFGRSVTTYQEEAFQEYTKTIQKEEVKDSGLFMPLFIQKEQFLLVEGYPEGNIKPGSDIFLPKIADQGEQCISGDVVLMEKLKSKGIYHQTSFDSIVYHFQEGEMDSKKAGGISQNKHIAICNDFISGTMDEKVLWDFLLEGLPSSYGVDTEVIGKENFAEKSRAYISDTYPDTSVLIQNASFIDTIDSSRYTISFLQDNLRLMNKNSKQQERNLTIAKKLVTNSLQIALSYPEYDLEIIPIGVNEKLFFPMDKKKLRKKYAFRAGKIGIFVGNFSEVKGWSKVKECIEKFPEITWILVSKYEETFNAPNARVYNHISQSMLAELYNCADFFIIGSPVETQCLAAIEAALCDIPLIMRNVGIFKNFMDEERSTIGIFGEDFITAIKMINTKKFTPRKNILNKNLTIDHMLVLWRELLEKVFQ